MCIQTGLEVKVEHEGVRKASVSSKQESSSIAEIGARKLEGRRCETVVAFGIGELLITIIAINT